jgi:hypothetical protein
MKLALLLALLLNLVQGKVVSVLLNRSDEHNRCSSQCSQSDQTLHCMSQCLDQECFETVVQSTDSFWQISSDFGLGSALPQVEKTPQDFKAAFNRCLLMKLGRDGRYMKTYELEL